MAGDYRAGRRVMAISRQRLWRAPDDLVSRLGSHEAKKLDVRAGEHLAAILTTAFLGVAPAQVDSAGGVDLLFDLTDVDANVSILTGEVAEAAFEVKSLPGRYREFDAAMDRDEQRGMSTIGRSLSVPVRAASDVMREAGPWVGRAADQLRRKTRAGTSRNVFLVAHPLDHLVVECVNYPTVSHVLGPPDNAEGLDSIWLLCAPSHLVVWSSGHREWIDLIFSALTADDLTADEADEGDRDELQKVEELFLELIGWSGGSPYLFTVR